MVIPQVSDEDKALFDKACDKIINKNCLTGGIGTLSEKTMHAVVKNFYEPDEIFQEQKVGNFVADIFKDDEIIEIQTRNLNALRKKLTAFLPEYPVTVVHPVVHQKMLIWIDPETGELSEPRKVSRKGTPLGAFRELYKIKMFLHDPNLSVVLLLVNATEYRVLNSNPKYQKKHTVRYDRIPTELVGELILKDARDYLSLIPETLPDEFKVKEIAKAAKITERTAGYVVNIMKDMGAIEKVGEDGRAYVYRRAEL